jgi:RimJ/RimL family protein N-acetyltransferase
MQQESSFRLRSLEERDLEAVARFESEIAKISFPEDPITDLGFYVKKLRPLLTHAEAATFVAEDETGVVGWAYVSQRRNFITKERYADFHSIYVAPSQRGKGVVSALVEAVFDYCRGEKLDRVVFRTRASNEPMKAVLARSGFVPAQIYYEKELRESMPDQSAAERRSHRR